MAKNNQPKKNQPQAGAGQQKVQTKYDRKMEARKKQEEKDKREAKMMRIGAIAACVAIAAAIVVSVGMSVWNKKAATKDAYVTVGGHAITKLEYDYYYQAAVNNYSSLLSYMGVDATSDLSKQQYTADLTWKDFFDEMTVEQMKQAKALGDDAAANNFDYDVSQEYSDTVSAVKASAESAGVSVGEYYKRVYGDYATEKNMEPFIKENILTNAYYNHLVEQNAPDGQEIKNYYEENKRSYDKVDYRSFIFSAEVADDASEDEADEAMADAREKAKAMMDARQKGEDFNQLCLENAAEEDKAAYEDAEADASLNEGVSYSTTPVSVGAWLYEDGRKEGDLTVVEDTAGNRCYVLEFINRYYDEASDANISSTLASQRTSEYVSGLTAGYEVVDNKGDLKYLTAETQTEEDAAEDTGTNAGSAGEDAAENAGTEDAASDGVSEGD